MLKSALSESIVGRAAEEGLVDIETIDIREFAKDKNRRVDDTPFGGGAGMLIMAEPVLDAIKSVESYAQSSDLGVARKIYLSPRGRLLSKEVIDELLEEKELTILCGHYEGVDERALEGFEEISIGDYILSGGEPAAVVLIDSIVRMLPGAIGNADSHGEESIYSGLLEYPQWTKPRSIGGRDVPEVLCGGNHAAIHLFQFEASLRLTKKRRGDLFANYVMAALYKGEINLSENEKRILKTVIEED
jgi:tRNA (guanine37-N1)-methyltransferase